MPYVNIKITREGATASQKAELIKGVTDLLVTVLEQKSPSTTVVVMIDEVEMEHWGIGGLPVEEFRKRSTAVAAGRRSASASSRRSSVRT